MYRTTRVLASLLLLIAGAITTPAHAVYQPGIGICETSTTTGTGTLNLAGAYTTSIDYLTFASQVTSGSTVPYTIESSDGKFEHGEGVFTDAGTDTLSRVSSIVSSDGTGTKLTLPTGTHIVCVQSGFTTTITSAAPARPNVGDDWFDIDSGIMYTYIDDGTSSQWVETASSGGVSSLYSADPGAQGPILTWDHDSPSPAASDIVATLTFQGEDTAGNDQEYGQINSTIVDATSASEDSSMSFDVQSGGSALTALTLGQSPATTGQFNPPAHVFNMGATEFPAVEIVGTAPNDGGPSIAIYHNSSTPAALDSVGAVAMVGEDSAGNAQRYSTIQAGIVDPTSTSEDSSLFFDVYSAGSALTALTLGGTDDFGVGPSALFTTTGASTGVQVQSTSTGANGAALTLHHDPSDDTEAASDIVGSLYFTGQDSGNAAQVYGHIDTVIRATTGGSESSQMNFYTYEVGVEDRQLLLGNNDMAGDGIYVQATVLGLDNDPNLRLHETEANGDNYKGFSPSSAITADTTCNFEDDANFIPDSCVGDGSDASDGRLKDIIAPAGEVGSLLDQIKLYDYRWTVDAPEASEAIRKGKRGFGPIAQELFNVNADWVEIGGESAIDDPWTWKPEKLVPYLIAETQSLRRRVKDLEAPPVALRFAEPKCYGLKLGHACIGVSM